MIVDSHTHLGFLAGYFHYNLKLTSLLDLMDRLDISYAISSHGRGLAQGDFDGSTNESLEAYKASGGRIMSYHIFDPNASGKCLDIIEKHNDRKVFKGIKIHPSWHNVPADDDRYDVIWKYASENKLVLISHTWDVSLANPVQKFSFPPLFERYIKAYPDVSIILAHSGGRLGGIREAAKLGRKYGNVYFDIAGDIYSNGFLEFLVGEVGAQRILFGTDYSMMDQRNMLGIVLGAKISLNDKEEILYKNAAKLFEIDVAEGGDAGE